MWKLLASYPTWIPSWHFKQASWTGLCKIMVVVSCWTPSSFLWFLCLFHTKYCQLGFKCRRSCTLRSTCSGFSLCVCVCMCKEYWSVYKEEICIHVLSAAEQRMCHQAYNRCLLKEGVNIAWCSSHWCSCLTLFNKQRRFIVFAQPFAKIPFFLLGFVTMLLYCFLLC